MLSLIVKITPLLLKKGEIKADQSYDQQFRAHLDPY